MTYPFLDGPLPSKGDREKHILDFKTRPSSKGALKLALNVAAMANASGGTLIVGAKEDPPDVLDEYDLFTAQQASDFARDYRNAVDARCVPRPLIATRTVARDTGFVLLVDVTPSLALIGVKLSDEKVEDYGQASWVFPVRINTSTEFASPDRFPMLMVPEVRRVAILLRRLITEAPNARAYVKYRDGGTFRVGLGQQGVAAIKLDEDGNSVLIMAVGTNKTEHFGLEEVESVFRVNGAEWCVKLKKESGP